MFILDGCANVLTSSHGLQLAQIIVSLEEVDGCTGANGIILAMVTIRSGCSQLSTLKGCVLLLSNIFFV